MADEPLRVAIFFASEAERERAEQALAKDPQGPTEQFSGVLEGWLSSAEAQTVADSGLAVQFLDLPSEPDEPTRTTKAVEDLKQDGRYASLSDDGQAIVVDEELAAIPDPRIHQYADFEATAPPDETAPAAVYFIELTGPITRDQRLQFFHEYGVDIGAFEPPNRYRAFLTPVQYPRVLALPYVRGIVRYSLEDTVTPELIQIASEVPGGGPALFAAEEEPIRTFDCLLHRERDLPIVRDLIERTAETTVVDASNLRIRFRGPVNRPLLAALAALPAVRKLSPYEPPTL